MNPTNTYILADNQDITREGLSSLLKKRDAHSEIVVAGSCAELQTTLRKYPQSVVILDYTLFDFASVHQMLNMKSGADESAWLLFSDELEEFFVRQTLLADPSIGIVMKQDSSENILEAIHFASVGETYWCDFADSVLKNSVPHTKTITDKLTASEKTILREIALGKTTKEIALEKYLSFHTVNTHRRNIFRKLGVNSAHEATKYALQAGLLDLLEYYI
ncbi:MAG: response regulator transcription factor [Dysgonamonadaceae bacterium]|jgi:DNA-binding NarL/FixJ family response regulator|nr:response regulator transcription factor [Dysgonamonadaceae bacterium]